MPVCTNEFGKRFVFNYYSSKGLKLVFYNIVFVSESQVLKYINKLGFKATGPSRFVKDSAAIIAYPLSSIINLFIFQGVVPEDLKLARVVPLYKNNDKTEVGNYLPVSSLSMISKVLERVIYDKVDLSEHKLLYDYQSGFRLSYFTETCLIQLTDFV